LTSPPDADDGLSRSGRFVLYGYGIAAMTPVALMLIFLVGSLVLSGAQVGPGGRSVYGALVRFPLFVVPDWLSIGCAIVATVLVVPLVVTTSVGYGGRLVGMVQLTCGSLVADGFFSLAFPAPTGLWKTPANPDVYLGAHLVGAGLSLLCIIILVVRTIATNGEYWRLRRAGKLPEGQF
jgi:hypothetical protein